MNTNYSFTHFRRFHLLLCCVLSVAAITFAREPAPTATDVDVAAAAKLLAEVEGIVVLDIRTPEEFAAGHIAGAINIDFLSDEFGEKIAALDQGNAYLMHCRSGGRSTRALEQFLKLDFRNLYHLTTGMNGWTEAGKPVEK